MNTEPVVSVVIPVYNGSNFLQYAIESALAQTYQKCEIIVVNDGSDDAGATKEVARKYGSRIKYVEQGNGGTAAALNHGLRIMNGDYFVWLSHDDVIRPYKVESQLRAIKESGNDKTIAQGNYSYINEATGGVMTTHFEEYYPMKTLTHGCFIFIWGGTHFSNLLFSSQHFDRVGIFKEDETTTQDQDMQFRLLRGQKSVFVKEPVSLFRMHGESESIKNKKLMFEENRILYLRMLKSLNKEEIESSGTNVGILYAHIAAVIHSMGDGMELSVAEEMLRHNLATSYGKRPEGLLAKILKQGIVIFGAGAYGRRIKYELESRSIRPQAFVDNSPLKWGRRIDGTMCYDIQCIHDMNSPYVVIGQRAYADAYQQLKANGYRHIILKDELDSLFWRIQPTQVPNREG